MRAHLLQHVPFEGLGSIEPWLTTRGAGLTATRFFLGEGLPALEQIDFLIAMGGPMSVNDEAAAAVAQIREEFIRKAVLRGTPMLGVCLGAQLLASALGARVYPNQCKEVGWFPIQAVPTTGGAFKFPTQCIAFHWHGETFDLPEGAIQLARSPACENQAFQLKRNAIGLQFHLETTPASARAIIENCRAELIPGPYIQSEAELQATPNESYTAINSLMNDVLSCLLPNTS